MKQALKFATLLAICTSCDAFGASPDCEVDLSKALEGKSSAAPTKVSVPRTACARVAGGGSLVVSDTKALRLDVIEWKELDGGAREAGVVRLTREKPGSYIVHFKRADATNVIVVTD